MIWGMEVQFVPCDMHENGFKLTRLMLHFNVNFILSRF